MSGVGRNHQRDRCASTYARSNALICVWYPRPCARNHSRTSSSIRRVSCRLRGGAFNPWRTTARANISGVSSGFSERSISSSRRASKRFQSVIDRFEECFSFTACRFSRGNDPNRLVGLGMHHREHPALHQSDGNEALFAVVGARVLDCDRIAAEHCLAISEVEPVLADVRLALFLVSFELGSYCSYNLACGQSCWAACRRTSVQASMPSGGMLMITTDKSKS